MVGLIRKITSATSGGLVDYRSDKERIARSSRQTAKELKRARKERKKGE